MQDLSTQGLQYLDAAGIWYIFHRAFLKGEWGALT